MIEEVTCYMLECDCCGEAFNDGDCEHLMCDSEHALKEAAMIEGWRLIDGKWHCPECVAKSMKLNENGDLLPQEE